MNLNQVAFPARDISESVAFYRRMGFTQIVDAPRYARFECPNGDATFSVHQMREVSENSGLVAYFETEHVDQLVSKLESIGFSFFQQPQDEPWLWREARLTDPSGNVLCLYTAGANRKNPPWRIPA